MLKMDNFNTGMKDVNNFDFRLQHPFSCVISGPSNSGKTYFVKMLLVNASNVICNKFDNVVYIYKDLAVYRSRYIPYLTIYTLPYLTIPYLTMYTLFFHVCQRIDNESI